MTEIIINTCISMKILKIADSFLRQKVGFLCSLINKRLDMKVKSIFAYTNLGMSLYFYIYIYYFFVFVDV